MLIDDDEDDKEIFLSVIANVLPQVSCVMATNGQEALQLLSHGQNRPDVIFLDLNMPLMNGKDFLSHISKDESLRLIPVIILSTSSDQGTIKEALNLGAKDFITKPDKFSAWEQTLKNVLINFIRQR
jgi:CheY-like chemotaxis protein